MNEDKSARYHRLKRRAAVLSLGLSLAVPAIMLATGAAVLLRDLCTALTHGAPWSPATVAAFALALVIVEEAAGFPLAYYRSFVLERRFGLSSGPLRVWIVDQLKAGAVAGVLALGAAEVVYATLRLWPSWWWLASAAAFMVAIGVIARLAPIVLLPLFYTFGPLQNPALHSRLLALSEKAGVPILGVFEWGLGEKTRRANAALVGAGKTRRILVSDTLLADYSDDEIEVILAHELAHHVHGDIWKGIVTELVLMTLALGAAALALRRFAGPLGLVAPADAAGMPLLVLAGGCVMLVATPVVNALSRRNERRADRYALWLTGRPAAFVSALRRLAAQNMAEERPSRVALWLFHSHPPIEERIEAARKALT